MDTTKEEEYAKKMCISRDNTQCKWCYKNPCESSRYGEEMDTLFEEAEKLGFDTVQPKISFVTSVLKRVVYGDRSDEGVCILPVCVTATVLRHFRGDDVINEMMGL